MDTREERDFNPVSVRNVVIHVDAIVMEAVAIRDPYWRRPEMHNQLTPGRIA